MSDRPEPILPTVQAWIEHQLGLSASVQSDLMRSAVIVGVLLGLRLVVVAVVSRRLETERSRYRLRQVSTYLSTTLGLLLVGRVWFVGVGDLTTYLGLVSAGVAIALRDPLVSMAGWLLILWRRPFDVGDRIAVGSHAGDVIDLRLFRFSMLEIGNWVAADQSTGRVLHLPNSMVFTEVIANYTRDFPFVWNELPVMVTFESNWRKAKTLLEEILERQVGPFAAEAEPVIREAGRKTMVFYRTLTPKVWTSVGDSGVVLTARYLCNARAKRSTAEGIWEDLLDQLALQPDIDLAYPTIRRYDNPAEGKRPYDGAAPEGVNSP